MLFVYFARALVACMVGVFYVTAFACFVFGLLVLLTLKALAYGYRRLT